MLTDANILIVDDSAAMRQTVKNTLISMGYENVHTAQTGQDALVKCRQCSYKIVFLDWNMPEMDGLTFLKIYRNEKAIKNTAVIMLTAHGDKNSILTAMENGATDYITKPVASETIQKKMIQAEGWLAAHGESK